MSASRSLLDQLKQDEDFSYTVSILERARPGSKCSELRERLSGGYGGRHMTFLAPTNHAVKKAAEAKGSSVELFCRMPQVAETLANHAVLDRWPLAALRMLGTPLESFQLRELAFLPTGASANAVSVKLSGSRTRPIRVSGDIPCRNGLLHKLGRLLTPAKQGWQGIASREEAVQRANESQQEMLKDRRELNGKTWAGPPPPGPVSKALAARRTVSAHDRQRAQAFAPLYGDDYEPRVYTGDKPLPPKRDFSQLRASPTVSRDRVDLGQAPTRDDVWEEWEPLKREEMRLQSELESFQKYLQSKEAVIAEHAAFVREVLPPSGLGWSRLQKPLVEVLLSSADEHQLLQSCISSEDPKLVTKEVRLRNWTVPPRSRLCSELPRWTSKLWVTLELPEILPRATFPLWSAPSDVSRGMESRLQHVEAHLLVEQARETLQSGDSIDVAELANRIAKKADCIADVFSWMEHQGICWSLTDQHKFARLCEATAPFGTHRSKGTVSVEDQEDSHQNLFRRHVDANTLRKVLSLPPLPEDHSELQSLMAHLRHLSSLLSSRHGQVMPSLKQEVNAKSDSIDVLRGRLEVLESSMPSQWSPPIDLWEELMGTSTPPPEAADALKEVSEAAAEARRKAVRNGEETAVAAEALKASATEKLRQVTWLESQAAFREAEIELLKQHLHEQDDRIKDLEVERRAGRNRMNMLNMMDAEEAERRADALSWHYQASKVQKAWRRRQCKARLQLKAVLLLQFRIRRWRKRRILAAQRIQAHWHSRQRHNQLDSQPQKRRA